VSRTPEAYDAAQIQTPVAPEEGRMKRLTIIYLALAVIAFIVMQPAVHAQSDTVAAITKLENDNVKADLAGDRAWSEKYLADDYLACDSDGKWFTKADILKLLNDSKNNNFKNEKISDLKVRVYGSTAVATYQDIYDATLEGKHHMGSVQSTDVWVKTGSDWKLVSSQNTTIK
jgi:hypothetical protein